MAALPTFKRGYIWRVGNGEKINIWPDRWIASSADGKVTTARGGILFSKVSDLISPITTSWDEHLLRDIFNDADVERILQIPLNNLGFDDFIAWKETSHGRYTVKSGYYMQWRYQFGPNGSQLAHQGVLALNPVWRSLWKLNVPVKIKIFIWRTLHGIIPLKCILANRHIGDSAACPICFRDA
jgi:hypothetical protein